MCHLVNAALFHPDEQRMLVEPACGAALAAIYSNIIPQLQAQGKLPNHIDNIVIIVCGGSSVTMETLKGYQAV